MSNYEPQNNHEPIINQPLKPVDIFRKAKKNPEIFWQENIRKTQEGFSRSEFVGPSESATLGIVIPAHNETLGSKNGNLQACLYALSQQEIPAGFTVKVIIISHNSSDNDQAAQLASKASNKIEIIHYTTPLKGFSYPLQMAGLLWRESEVKEVGVIDADTVVNSKWLQSMHSSLHQSENIGAVAAPRGYLKNDGSTVVYGNIKTTAEIISHRLRHLSAKVPKIVKLVSGNSYFFASALQAAIEPQIGGMVTDGDIQDQLEKLNYATVLSPEGFAISEGGKFADLSPAALLKKLLERVRIVVSKSPNLDDHIRFILFELASYFPDFKKEVQQYVPQYEQINRFGSTDEQQQLLETLRSEVIKFNQINAEQMHQDIALITSQRKLEPNS